jgi:hypothetical protein
LQVTEEHWANGSQESTATANEKIPVKPAADAAKFIGIFESVTPMGFEPMLPP